MMFDSVQSAEDFKTKQDYCVIFRARRHVRKSAVKGKFEELNKRFEVEFDKLFENPNYAKFLWYAHVRKLGLDKTNNLLREDPEVIFMLKPAVHLKWTRLRASGKAPELTRSLIKLSRDWFGKKLLLQAAQRTSDVVDPLNLGDELRVGSND